MVCIVRLVHRWIRYCALEMLLNGRCDVRAVLNGVTVGTLSDALITVHLLHGIHYLQLTEPLTHRNLLESIVGDGVMREYVRDDALFQVHSKAPHECEVLCITRSRHRLEVRSSAVSMLLVRNMLFLLRYLLRYFQQAQGYVLLLLP